MVDVLHNALNVIVSKVCHQANSYFHYRFIYNHDLFINILGLMNLCITYVVTNVANYLRAQDGVFKFHVLSDQQTKTQKIFKRMFLIEKSSETVFLD